MSVTEKSVDLVAFRHHIEKALGYGDDTHTFADVQDMVAAGKAQFFPGPASCIVTELVLDPRRKSVHFFLAAGKMSELEIMTPHILDWAKSEGCTHATLSGRKGWQRSFLSRTGWQTYPIVIMHKAL